MIRLSHHYGRLALAFAIAFIPVALSPHPPLRMAPPLACAALS